MKRIKNYGRKDACLFIEVPPDLQDLQEVWLFTEIPLEAKPSVMRFVLSVTADYAASSGDNAAYDITDALKEAMYTALDEGLLNCEYRSIGHEFTVTRSENV